MLLTSLSPLPASPYSDVLMEVSPHHLESFQKPAVGVSSSSSNLDIRVTDLVGKFDMQMFAAYDKPAPLLSIKHSTLLKIYA